MKNATKNRGSDDSGDLITVEHGKDHGTLENHEQFTDYDKQ